MSTVSDEEEEKALPKSPLSSPLKTEKNSCSSHNSEQIKFLCKLSGCRMLMCQKCFDEHKKVHKKKEELSEDLLGRYHFIKYMGKGSFGHVFAVEYKLQRFALKVMDIFENAEDSMTAESKRQYIESLRSEINIHKQLRHDYIVFYYNDFFIEAEEKLVIEMELCDGSLANVIQDINPNQALVWFAQICSAVSYLHEQDESKRKPEILHRDLKPGNILLKDRKVKVCDFGGAKLLTQTRQSRSNTSKENFFGTQEYLAPEIFSLEVKRFTKATDIWALGVIFFRMINKGKHPLLYDLNEENMNYDQKIDNMTLILDAYSHNPSKLKDLLKSLPMSKIFLRCLEFDPKTRIEISDLIDLLETELFRQGLNVSQILESSSNSEFNSNSKKDRPKSNITDNQSNPDSIFNSNKDRPKSNIECDLNRTQVDLNDKTEDEETLKNKIFVSEVIDKSSESENSETLNIKANDYFRKKDYEKALENYTKAAAMSPLVAKYYSNMSACLIHLSKFNEALQCADKCLALDPQFVRGYSRKGQIHFEKKEFFKAWSAYQEGLKIDLNNHDCTGGIENLIQKCSFEEKSLLADELKQNAEERAINGEWQRSLEFIDQAIQLSPKRRDLVQIKAEFFFKMKKYDQAISEAKNVCELDPGNCEDALGIISDSNLRLNRIEEALMMCNKILEKNPENKKAKTNIKLLKEEFPDKFESKPASKNQSQPKSPQKTKTLVDILLENQKDEGYWENNTKTAKIMGKKIEKLNAPLNELTNQYGHFFGPDVWMTAIVLYFLRGIYSDERDSWELQWKNGKKWLKGNGFSYRKLRDQAKSVIFGVCGKVGNSPNLSRNCLCGKKLKYVNEIPSYKGENFRCNFCKASNKIYGGSFHCETCTYDLCEECNNETSIKCDTCKVGILKWMKTIPPPYEDVYWCDICRRKNPIEKGVYHCNTGCKNFDLCNVCKAER